MAKQLEETRQLYFVLAFCSWLIVALSSVNAYINLQLGTTGVVPCPWIEDKTYAVNEVDSMYWYNGMGDLLISNFRGSISDGPDVPHGKYGLSDTFSLLINNVAYGDGGIYEGMIKPTSYGLQKRRVNVTISGVTEEPTTPAAPNDNEKQTGGIGPGATIGISFAIFILVVAILVAIFCYFKKCKRRERDNVITYEAIEPIELGVRVGEEDQVKNELREHLKTHYKQVMNKISTHTSDQSSTRTIDDMYVHPVLCKTGHKNIKAKRSFKQKKDSEEKKIHEKIMIPLNSLDDLIGHLLVEHHVALVGSAGFGRATIVKKIAYEWAVGKLCSSFWFVFVLGKKDFDDGSSGICDAIRKLLPTDSKITKQQIKDLITKNQKEVLFLLEDSSLQNTDHSAEDDFSVKDLLSVQTLRGCYLLVTISPHQRDTLQNLFLDYSVVLTTGYSPKEMREYIRKFFDNDVSLMKEIKSNKVMQSLAKSPIMLQLLCLIWDHTNSLPKQNNELYDKVVDALAVHAIRKDSQIEQDKEKVKELKENIGKVAIKGFIDDRVLLDPSDFSDRDALAYGLKIGVLCEETKASEANTYDIVEFLFQFQEYFASCYFSAGSYNLGNSSEITDVRSRLVKDGWRCG